MLVELRNVEVYIEPEEILTKAIREGDLDVETVVKECVYEESTDRVLEVLDQDEIESYCKRNGIGSNVDFESVLASLSEWNQEQKALLLWRLIRSEVHNG